MEEELQGDVYEVLRAVQMELKAPKNLFNSFGGFKYRSAESILEAAKPILEKHGATLYLTDEMVCVGDRNYCKANAVFSVYGGGEIVTTAYAREDPTKKGMDGSQITGAASSYARKYALNGMFLIDDTKDPDTDEFRNEGENRAAQQKMEADSAKKISAKDAEILKKTLSAAQLEWFLKTYHLEKAEDATKKQYADVFRVLNERDGKQGKAS